MRPGASAAGSNHHLIRPAKPLNRKVPIGRKIHSKDWPKTERLCLSRATGEGGNLPIDSLLPSLPLHLLIKLSRIYGKVGPEFT